MNCAELVSFPVFQIYYVQYIYILIDYMYLIYIERGCTGSSLCTEQAFALSARDYHAVTMLSFFGTESSMTHQRYFSGHLLNTVDVPSVQTRATAAITASRFKVEVTGSLDAGTMTQRSAVDGTYTCCVLQSAMLFRC